MYLWIPTPISCSLLINKTCADVSLLESYILLTSLPTNDRIADCEINSSAFTFSSTFTAMVPAASMSELSESSAQTLGSTSVVPPAFTGLIVFGSSIPSAQVEDSTTVPTSAEVFVLTSTDSPGSITIISSTSVVQTPSVPAGGPTANTVIMASDSSTMQSEGASAEGATTVAVSTPTESATGSSQDGPAGVYTVANSPFPNGGPLTSVLTAAEFAPSSAVVDIPILVFFNTTNESGTPVTDSSVSTFSIPASAVGRPQPELTSLGTSLSQEQDSTATEFPSVIEFPTISPTSLVQGQGSTPTESPIVNLLTMTNPSDSIIITSNILIAQEQGSTPTESPIVNLLTTTNPSGSVITTSSTSIAQEQGFIPANSPMVMVLTMTNPSGSVITTSSTSIAQEQGFIPADSPNIVTLTTTNPLGSIVITSSALNAQGQGSTPADSPVVIVLTTTNPSGSVITTSSTSLGQEQGSTTTESPNVLTTTSPSGSVIAESSASLSQEQGPTPTLSPVVIIFTTTSPAGSVVTTSSTATALIPSLASSDVISSLGQTVAPDTPVLFSFPTAEAQPEIAGSNLLNTEQSVGPVPSLLPAVVSQSLDTVRIPSCSATPRLGN